MDLSTGLPALTSLFSDVRPIAEDPAGVTALYVHIPSSAIVEERFGWEALEAYRVMIATYLSSYARSVRIERNYCVIARTFADDFVLLYPRREDDSLELTTQVADGVMRHLLANDDEIAGLLQIYVGLARSNFFGRIHPERLVYRLIQQAQTEATDVVRQQIAAKVRVLDHCIAANNFAFVYQPIVRMLDHSIFGYEALVRCPQPELRSPLVLFDVAEQGERIQPLSRLLRRLAASATSELPAEATMFVNLHPRDFEDPELLERDTPSVALAQRTILEVTERAAITDLDDFRQQLRKLRELGFRIAMDDVGSGYSTLALVAEVMPDMVKLDMTLVRDIDSNPVRRNLVRNMVSFARDMNASVVAEGVETRAELETLRELGCDMVQGYYLARPAPPFVEKIDVPPVPLREEEWPIPAVPRQPAPG